MQITTKLSIDMATGAVLEHHWYEYEGEVALCKGGDKTVEAGEHSQQGFINTLMGTFRQQFGASSAILNFLNNRLTQMATNPTGFAPSTKAALTTNAIQQSATDVANAQRAANTAAAAHGGNGLPSGVQAQVAGQIQAAGANEETDALNNIRLADAQQQQENYWNAIKGLSGVASAEDPTAYGSLVNSGQGALAGLSNADTGAKQTGFGNSFANGFGSALGKGLGSIATGGAKFSNPFKG